MFAQASAALHSRNTVHNVEHVTEEQSGQQPAPPTAFCCASVIENRAKEVGLAVFDSRTLTLHLTQHIEQGRSYTTILMHLELLEPSELLVVANTTQVCALLILPCKELGFGIRNELGTQFTVHSYLPAESHTSPSLALSAGASVALFVGALATAASKLLCYHHLRHRKYQHVKLYDPQHVHRFLADFVSIASIPVR